MHGEGGRGEWTPQGQTQIGNETMSISTSINTVDKIS